MIGFIPDFLSFLSSVEYKFKWNPFWISSKGSFTDNYLIGNDTQKGNSTSGFA